MEIITNFIINNSKKLLIALISIIVLICTYLFINYKINFLSNIVIKNRDKWDLFLAQNTIMSGDYMGIMYEKDYDVNNMPSDLVSMLFVDYYINHKEDFFSEKNKNTDNASYTKELTKEEIENTKKALFGPDYNVNLESIDYGCNRTLKKSGDTYKISSEDPETCGLFSPYASNYISYIADYQKNNKDIIITLKVAYIEPIYESKTTIIKEDNSQKQKNDEEDFYDETLNENNEEEINYDEDMDSDYTTYKAFTNKTKTTLINKNYPPKCTYEEDKTGSCYEGFSKYQVTLKKASDGEYYFYSINKQN